MNGVPVALQSRDPACPAGQVEAFFPCQLINLFCLPRQERFFLAFWAEKGQNTVKSGFGAVDRLLRSPIYCFQGSKTVKDDGVLFEFLCSVKKEQKGLGGRTRTLIESFKKSG